MLFKQSFELRHVLNDDTDGDFTGAHGGKQLVKLVGQRHVRKLIHDKMDMDGEPSAMHNVSRIIELLEKLRVEHTYNEVEAGIVVRDDRKHGGFSFSHQRQLQFVVLGDGGERFQVELLQAGDQRDLNGFQSLAAAGVIAPIVFQGDVLRTSVLQLLEQDIQRRDVVFVILLDLAVADHIHDHGEVLFLLRRFVVQIEHQRQQEHRRCLIPERVLRLTALRRGVLEQVRYQPLNVVVVPQIDKGIVAMAFLHVDKVNHLDLIALCFEQRTGVSEQLTFRVQDDKRGVGIHDVGLGIEPCFTGTGTAAD